MQSLPPISMRCALKNLIWLCLCTAAVSGFAQTWTQSSAPSNYWQCVASSADGTILAAGADQIPIYISTNSGANWQISTSPYLHWYALASSADGKRWIAAAALGGGAVYVSTNSGMTWTANASLPGADWRSVASSADGQKLAAAIWNGAIYTSTNAGTSWKTNNLPVASWSCLASSADGKTLLAGVSPNLDAYVVASTNGGISWVSNGIPSYCDGVAVSANGNLLATAVLGNQIYISTNAGNSWSPAGTPSTPWRSIAISADGTGLVAVANTGGPGVIYTSTNSGVNWVSNSVVGQIWDGCCISADGQKMAAVASSPGYTREPIYTSITTPAPHLGLTRSNLQYSLSWLVPSTNFVLQQSADLASWSTVTNVPVFNFTNLHYSVTLPSSVSNSFFRLSTP